MRMQQMEFFQDTSTEAELSIDKSKLERLVLKAIGEIQPCISDEVRDLFPNFSYSSVTARYASLHRKGLITYAGKRPGKSGRNQRIMTTCQL